MKKIYYWGPFIENKIATINAIYNSVIGINKYSNDFNAKIINSVGEWNFKIQESNKKLFINSKINIINFLPRNGWVKSRISYFIIFILCIFNITKLLKNSKPDYFIAHLIVSLPMVLFSLFNFDTKLVVRISGKPKLNFFRKLIWKINSKVVFKVFCPTEETKKLLIQQNIFSEKKIFVLNDPVIFVEQFRIFKRDNKLNEIFENNNIILVGRLTKQKNFRMILDAYKMNEYLKLHKIFIFGEGEDYFFLKKEIIKNNLQNKIFLMKYENNIFKYLLRSKLFILTSLWEDPGFVLIESGLCNLNIISSNCPSGPEEIIDKKELGGYLYCNNDLIDLNSKLNSFFQENPIKLIRKKIFLKKKIKKYTVFNHSITLNRYLQN